MLYAIGKKTKEWTLCKGLLVPAFESAGITHCEAARIMQFDDHRHWYFLTWAHGDKRRNLVGNELLRLVILACVDCHNFLEKLPREQMREIIEWIIAHRSVQPATMQMDVPYA